MPLSESDTRAKLIDPAIHQCGWTEDLIRREETAGAIEIGENRPRRRSKGRVDYVLRVRAALGTQPVGVALIEAKTENPSPTHDLEQATLYAARRRRNVPFVFANNGYLFVEYDRNNCLTPNPRAFAGFPTPDVRCHRCEVAMGFLLNSETARSVIARYPGGEATRSSYHDAAIRAVPEKLARAEKRARLSLVTGAACLPSIRRDNARGIPPHSLRGSARGRWAAVAWRNSMLLAVRGFSG